MLTLNLKKGLDLKLQGGVDPAGSAPLRVAPVSVAVFPADFPGFVPKLAVKEGDHVAAGQPLLLDKSAPDVALVAPVPGVVREVLRAERRRIERVVVEPDDMPMPAVTFDLAAASRPEGLRLLMQHAGLWVLMRQRPYDIVPAHDSMPRDIMVTAFDSAPLAPRIDAALDRAEIERGIAALATLTPGKVYVAVNTPDAPAYNGAEMVSVSGPHPAGLPGVQIANIKPVNKGETVWTLDVTAVARLGHLLNSGTVDFTTDVAVTGSEVEHPYMARTVAGADLTSILGHAGIKTDAHNKRVIAGNVLTGVHSSADGWLHFPWRQVTVIPEGDDVDEFMGWASNSLDKMSESRSFLAHFLKGRRFAPDARLHGGRRAMIMSGEYDRVLPMDIYPEYLIKAILARDIDRMEALGIYEVAPEDFALCEYVDPSKLELQRTVREGLEWLRKELG